MHVKYRTANLLVLYMRTLSLKTVHTPLVATKLYGEFLEVPNTAINGLHKAVNGVHRVGAESKAYFTEKQPSVFLVNTIVTAVRVERNPSHACEDTEGVDRKISMRSE